MEERETEQSVGQREAEKEKEGGTVKVPEPTGRPADGHRGPRVPHSELVLPDFSLEALEAFPDKVDRFEKEHKVPWDRSFFNKNMIFPLTSRWNAWPGRMKYPNTYSFDRCPTPVLAEFFKYLVSHFHPHVASTANHIDRVTRFCAIVEANPSKLNPMNTSGTLELLGGFLLSQDLLGIELDRLNRNELDRVRYSIKISLTRSSEDQDSVNFWNTIMARGPDSIAGGEAPVRGTTISKWFHDQQVVPRHDCRGG